MWRVLAPPAFVFSIAFVWSIIAVQYQYALAASFQAACCSGLFWSYSLSGINGRLSWRETGSSGDLLLATLKTTTDVTWSHRLDFYRTKNVLKGQKRINCAHLTWLLNPFTKYKRFCEKCLVCSICIWILLKYCPKGRTWDGWFVCWFKKNFKQNIRLYLFLFIW